MGPAPLWKWEHEATCSHLGRPRSREGPEAGLAYKHSGESSVTHFLTSVLEPPPNTSSSCGPGVQTHELPHGGYSYSHRNILLYEMKRLRRKDMTGPLNPWLLKFKCSDNYWVVDENKGSKWSIDQI